MLPTKLTAGQNFKQSVVRAINEIIDCLRKQRVVGDNNTIQVSEGTNGVLIRAIPQGSSPKGGSKFVEKHPFKLSIATDETDVQVLTIQRGLVKIQGSNNDRCIFAYEENESSLPENLPLPTEEGTYNVIGYVAKYLPTDTPVNDDGAFRHGVVYCTSNVNGDITSSYGFWTFVIGKIIVAVDENENISYTIDAQYLKSDIVIDDSAKSDLYSPLLYKSTYPTDGDVVADFICDKIRVTSGLFGTPEGKVVVPENTFDLADGKTIVISYDMGQNTAVYEIMDTASLPYTDETETICYFPAIGIVEDEYTSWIIKRYIKDSFYGFDSYKIKVDGEDTTPEFIRQKIKNEEMESSAESDEDYINILYKNEAALNEPIDKSMKFYWRYKDIAGYNATKQQYILNNKDSLCFDDAGKVRVNSNDTTLGFLASKLVSGYYTTAKTVSDSVMKIDARGVEAGEHIDVTTVSAGENYNWKIDALPGAVTAGTNIEVVTSEDQWTNTVSLKIVGTGIVIVTDNTVSVLPFPTVKSVLGFNGTGLAWLPYDDCENSCS